jgi:hypothetical protein
MLRLLDANNDGFISPGELRSFVAKVVALAFVLFSTVLFAGMEAASAAVPSLLTIALHIKAELAGGSAHDIRKEEVLAVFGGQVSRIYTLPWPT